MMNLNYLERRLRKAEPGKKPEPIEHILLVPLGGDGPCLVLSGTGETSRLFDTQVEAETHVTGRP